jgi:opacity protein-like surface antigen
MRRIHLAAACVLAGLLSTTAQAADNGFYFGGSIGRSEVDVDSELDDFVDSEDTGFKLIAGFRPLDWLGVEASYIDLGEVTADSDLIDDFSVAQSGFGAWGVLFYDFAVFDLFVKGGLVNFETEVEIDTGFGRFDESDDSTDFAWGVGVQARLGSIAARLEYERFEVDAPDGFDKPQMISLGVTYTLL